MDQYQKIKDIVAKYPAYFQELTDEYDKMKIGRSYAAQLMIDDLYWKACIEKIEGDDNMCQLMNTLSINESAKKHYSIYDSSCMLS